MATREFTRVLTGEVLRNAISETAAPPPPVDKTIYVRLDEEAAKAKLTREGFQFPSLEPDVGKIKDYVDHLPPLAPHVLSQTPAKGTKVPRGSTVEVVMGYGGD